MNIRSAKKHLGARVEFRGLTPTDSPKLGTIVAVSNMFVFVKLDVNGSNSPEPIAPYLLTLAGGAA